MDLISIIIPAFNAEKTIAKCLESIISQDYINWECIIVNDGSTDKTKDLLNFYASDERFVIINKKNQGVSEARNDGLNRAKGEWICFVDSDDWVEPNYLSNLINDWPKESSTIVISNYITENYEGENLPNFIEIEDSKFKINEGNSNDYKMLLTDGYPFNKLFNLNIINQNNLRFNTSISLGEDHEFYFKYLLNIENIILKKSKTYHYVIGNTNALTSRKKSSEAYLNSGYAYMDSLLKLIPKLNKATSKEGINLFTNTIGMNSFLKSFYSIDKNNYKKIIELLRYKKDWFSQFPFQQTYKKYITNLIFKLPPIIDFYMIKFLKSIYRSVKILRN